MWNLLRTSGRGAETLHEDVVFEYRSVPTHLGSKGINVIVAHERAVEDEGGKQIGALAVVSFLRIGFEDTGLRAEGHLGEISMHNTPGRASVELIDVDYSRTEAWQMTVVPST